MALGKQAFSVALTHTLNSPTRMKMKILMKGFKDGMRKGFQGPVVHNTGILGLAGEWNATQLAQHVAPQALVQPVHSTQTSSAHPGLHCRSGCPREKWSASLWQQLGNRKRNGNVWKHSFPGSCLCWLLEELPWALLVLHALLTNAAAFVSTAPWHIPCCKTEPTSRHLW